MQYKFPLHDAVMIRRYKRFLCDVVINGEMMTVLCPNTGSMAGLTGEGNPVRISGPYEGRGRKYLYTLEQVQISRPDGRKVWVGVNTQLPNYLVEEAVLAGKIQGLAGYTETKREVKIGEHSRIDLVLSGDGLPKCWVEVKNVTLVMPDPMVKERFNQGNIAAFPDAVTTRGAKHLRELVRKIENGDRGAMVYCIQRDDAELFAPAVCFDPGYTEELERAVERGVEVYPVVFRVGSGGVEFGKMVKKRFVIFDL